MIIYINFEGDTFSEIVDALIINAKKTYLFDLSTYLKESKTIGVTPIVYIGGDSKYLKTLNSII